MSVQKRHPTQYLFRNRVSKYNLSTEKAPHASPVQKWCSQVGSLLWGMVVCVCVRRFPATTVLAMMMLCKNHVVRRPIPDTHNAQPRFPHAGVRRQTSPIKVEVLVGVDVLCDAHVRGVHHRNPLMWGNYLCRGVTCRCPVWLWCGVTV